MDIISGLILILTVVLCLPLFKEYRRQKAISKCIDHLPGEKKYPIFGTTLKIILNKREMLWTLLKDRHTRFGPIFRSWMGSIPIVSIYKAEHAQIIFKSNVNLNKGKYYNFFRPWMGGGLVTGNLPKWRHHRKVINPAFHYKVLEGYGDIFAEKGEEFALFLDQFHGKGYVDITQYVNQITFDVICETAMGVQLNFLKNAKSDYADAVHGFLQGAYKRMHNPLLQIDFIFNLTSIGKLSKRSIVYIRDFNKKVIEQRKEEFSRSKGINSPQEDEFGQKEKMSFLDILLAHQEKNNFMYEEIEEEVNTFMSAGQETSASALTFAFMALGNHPEIQKRVQDELDALFADDPNRKVTTKDVAKMDYMEMVINEVLRLYYFMPFMGRELLEDVDIDGLHIPKGVSVTISGHDLHHDPEHYPDPWKFDPDRFLSENVEKRHPYAFVPFSAGPRICIGQKFAMQSIKTILAYALRRHNVKCTQQPEDIKYYYEIILKPQDGIHVAIEPRH